MFPKIIKVFAVIIMVHTFQAAAENALGYTIHMLQITDYEDLRPLFEDCRNLGELETLRQDIDQAADYEKLRPLFENLTRVTVFRCSTKFRIQGVEEVE